MRALPLAALALTLAALTTPARADLTGKPADRPTIADFALDTLDGGRVKLADFAGRPVVISFWATWCKPCKQELPFLDAFARQYADRGLAVIAINTDGPRTLAEVSRFVRQKDLKIPQLLDKEGAVLARLNPRGVMPFSLYLDRDHRVAATHDSFTPGDEKKIEAAILALLSEGNVPPAAVPAAVPGTAPAVPAPAP
jgi:thiol-disulfide isomerase/thioredoxin